MHAKRLPKRQALGCVISYHFSEKELNPMSDIWSAVLLAKQVDHIGVMTKYLIDTLMEDLLAYE